MFYKVSNLKMPITSSFDEVFSACEKIMGISHSDVLSRKILRKSIDARRKDIHFIYSALIETNSFVKTGDNVKEFKIKEKEPLIFGNEKLSNRPVVVGFGPCGIFCALTLAKHGYAPVVLERGSDVDSRSIKVSHFWEAKELDTNSNVQFGEGGAGTFSDGKLTCRNGDALIDEILEIFVRHGAPEDILYSSLPHIGTDILKNVIKSIREEIISLGGKILFNAQVCDMDIKNGKLSSLKLNDGSNIPCDVAVFAIGHSARDTYKMLFDKGIKMIPKTFSVGVRCEHLRQNIDEALYGDFAGHPALGAASYQLSHHENSVGCYSFCMCPGGTVVTSSSEEEMVVVNGMSNRARDGRNSNAAVVVSLGCDDIAPINGSLVEGMIELQRTIEEKAFLAGGENYAAPIQTVGDFMSGKTKHEPSRVLPTYMNGFVKVTDLSVLFPNIVNQTLRYGLSSFDQKIPGFAASDAVLTGAETRTSAPVRITRNEQGTAIGFPYIYPCGEGAGYAGGITSAAVDGVKTALAVMKRYAPYRD